MSIGVNHQSSSSSVLNLFMLQLPVQEVKSDDQQRECRGLEGLWERHLPGREYLQTWTWHIPPPSFGFEASAQPTNLRKDVVVVRLENKNCF